MNKIFFPILLLFLCLPTVASPTQGSKAIKQPLVSYLNQEAVTLDCYFTVEYYFNGFVPSALAPAEVVPKSWTSPAQLVTYLKTQLPGADVMVDQLHPKVIYIVDKPLTQQKVYCLNEAIDLSYSGPLSGLPKAIGDATKQTVSFLSSNNVAITSGYGQETQVKVDVKHTEGREAVTSAALLPQSNRQLWLASTSVVKGRNVTSIYFPAPGF